MILQLLRQLNNLDRSKTIACSASFCFGLSLRIPCPLPKRISSRILSKSMFIPQNHPKSEQRVRTCAVIEKPVFRASLAMSMLEIELYQISLAYDRGRSGYEIKMTPVGTALHFRRENENLSLSADVLHKTKNLAISRCCFADDGNEMDKSEKRTCRACKAIVFTH